jgi:hypothetical protein
MAKKSRLQAREFLVTSLRQAMAETNATQLSVANLAEVKPITVHRWLKSETAINVEAILACPGLAKAFRRSLCSEHHDPLPGYVAKKASR